MLNIQLQNFSTNFSAEKFSVLGLFALRSLQKGAAAFAKVGKCGTILKWRS